MVKLKTVLVLGAGASWDFGFPTGGELVTQILENLGNSENAEFRVFMDACSGEECSRAEGFHNVLEKAKPLSIDAWLAHNPTYIGMGKIAIAIALLKHEQEAGLRPKAKGDWYQLLFDRLNAPLEDFQKNELSIVSFNYDRSFEHRLFQSFTNTHTDGETEKEREEELKECKRVLNELNIVHVYGCLGRLNWQVENPKTPLTNLKYGAELRAGYVMTAAENIKIMPEKSKALPEGFQEARKLIADADALYFLGFGYDKTNMERLGVDASVKPSKVMGTAYGLDYQRRREVEQLQIKDLSRHKGGLVPTSVYEFLHDYIDFNELGLPDVAYK
jgi:hypothetical protein